MYYVYIIRDAETDRTYVGYTKDLRRRVREHMFKKVKTTQRMKNPRLSYYEAYELKQQAQTRERKLKQYGSAYKALLKRIEL